LRDVEIAAEQLAAHHAAFDVPARPAVTPRARPARLTRLGQLPQGEVRRVVQVGVALDAGPGLHLVEASARELAVAGLLLHIVVDPVGGGVGAAGGDQFADVAHHLGDVLRAARLVGDGADVQLGQPAVVLRDDAFGDRLPGLAGLAAAVDDLVVDVGDVVDEAHAMSARGQPAGDRVEDRRPHQVADVAVVVDRRAAHVHADLALAQGHERFGAAGQRVVDDDRHGGAGCRRAAGRSTWRRRYQGPHRSRWGGRRAVVAA